MIAVLLLSGAYGLIEGHSAFEALRRATFVIIGLAPFAFLIALVDARLARSAVGDLVVELRAEPAPAALRDALARALRDPSLTLAYWLPAVRELGRSGWRAVELPQPGDPRATTVIDREGEPVAALVHDPALLDEPELLDAVSAAAAIALENARLHAELRARLEEIRGSRARVIEAGQKERQRLERNLHDGAQQRLVALSLELGLLAGEGGGRPRAERAARSSPGGDRDLPGGAPRRRTGNSSGRRQRARPRGRARAARRRAPLPVQSLGRRRRSPARVG